MTKVDNRGQVCGWCGTINSDPLADYQNENGVLACSYRCYARLEEGLIAAHETHIATEIWSGGERTYRGTCSCGWTADTDWKARRHAEADADRHVARRVVT